MRRRMMMAAAGKAWTPANFDGGTSGAWFEAKPEYLYQDSAGTIPVSTDGDPVGYIADIFGNGNQATQANSAKRLIYRTDGTLHWLEGDGSDDILNTSYTTTTEGLSVVAFQANTKAATQIVFGSNDNSPRHYHAINSSDELQVGYGTSFNLPGINVVTAPSVSSILNTASLGVKLKHNGNNYNNEPHTDFGQLALSIMGVKNSFYTTGKFYGAVFLGSSTASLNDLNNAEEYFAGLAGISI